MQMMKYKIVYIILGIVYLIGITYSLYYIIDNFCNSLIEPFLISQVDVNTYCVFFSLQ